MLSVPEEVDYSLKVPRNEHNESNDGGKNESWTRSKASHMGHRQDARLEKQQYMKKIKSKSKPDIQGVLYTKA